MSKYCGVNGKECFKSRREAQMAADNMSFRHHSEASIYHCQFCHQWHLTHYDYAHSKAVRELNKKGFYGKSPHKKKRKDMRIFIDTIDDGAVMVDTYQPPEQERKGIMLAFTKESSPIAIGLSYDQALELIEALKIQTARI